MVAVLIVVWAVVLVPMWAHRHSTPPEAELSPGARVIARRPDSRRPDSWRPDSWRPDGEPQRRPSLPGTAHSARSGSAGSGSGTAPWRAKATTLGRRRAVLAGLTGALLVTALAVLAGLPSPVLLVPAAPCAGYVVWLRQTTVAAQTHRNALRRLVDAERAAGFRDFDAPAVVEGESAISSAGMPSPAPVGLSAQRRDASGAALDSAPDVAPSTAPWLPVPLPLPSYVTAAPAPTVIDGDWHEEILLEGELPGEASAYALGDDVLGRRAVGD